MRARTVVILCVSVFAVLLFLLRNLFVWGYHVASDAHFTGSLGYKLRFDPNDENHQEEVKKFASEICGEPIAFDERDPLVYYNLWAERSEVRRFFLLSSSSNIVWVTIGSPQYLCSARFLVTMRVHDCFLPIPMYCTMSSNGKIESVKLLSRTRERPEAPPNMRPLMLGECAMGRLAPGEATKYRAVVPELGRHVNVETSGVREFEPHISQDDPGYWEELRKRTSPPDPEVSIERNGRVVQRCMEVARANAEADCPGSWSTVAEMGGGIFDITLKAPANIAVVYQLLVAWGDLDGRRCPDHWDLRSSNETRDSR
jgi:hypothetical protein